MFDESIPMSRNSTNSGVSSATGGNKAPSSTTNRLDDRPGKRSRAKAYAIEAPRTTAASAAVPETSSEVHSTLRKLGAHAIGAAQISPNKLSPNSSGQTRNRFGKAVMLSSKAM